MSVEQLVSTLARDVRVDVNTGTAAVPAWTQVRGITDLKPKVDSTMKEDSDYDSDGWKSETKTAMGWSLELKVARKKGLTSGTFDAGQEALRLAADEFGADGIVEVRWYDRNGGPAAYSGFASVSWTDEGGKWDDLAESTATLSGQGKRNKIATPVTP